MSLRHALLGLLAEGPASGYDLLRRFNTSLNFVWAAQQSQVYGELAKMSDGGLIEVLSTGARNRKEYALTGSGRVELHRWLTETEPDRTIRNEALLRVFFLWALDPEEAAQYLKEMLAWSGERHRALEGIEATVCWRDTDADWYSRLALEYGTRVTRATVEWARWALDNPPGHSSESRVAT